MLMLSLGTFEKNGEEWPGHVANSGKLKALQTAGSGPKRS